MKNNFTWIEMLKFWAARILIVTVITVILICILYFKYR